MNGAIVPRSEEVASPIVTISVDDMDGTLRSIREHGGTIVSGKAPFGTRGYTAHFRDTEGNVMGLWQVRPRA